jgi:ADP-ribosylglycohydrolase
MTTRSLPADHDARMDRVRLALDGLSVGDAFGQRFFHVSSFRCIVEDRALPRGPWPYTDDTVMALGIAEVLGRHGRIDQDDLAGVFARRYWEEPGRGYGATAHEILMAIISRVPWRSAAGAAFGGEGSMGNGGGMRVAPVAGYFADELERVAAEARLSAAVTHAHPEGRAGAVAVAVAGAWAWQTRGTPEGRKDGSLLEAAYRFTPDGDTRQGLRKALALPRTATVVAAVAELGNGSRVTAPDTVPFALWCAARHLESYEDALWTTVAGAGDIDTNCAIVGGILALANGRDAIPAEWLAEREPLALA